VFVKEVVRKVSGPERKEVIRGSRILLYECMRREVLTVINIEIPVLWDVAPCRFIETTWSHIPEDHDLNFMNTLINCIFKIHMCV